MHPSKVFFLNILIFPNFIPQMAAKESPIPKTKQPKI